MFKNKKIIICFLITTCFLTMALILLNFYSYNNEKDNIVFNPYEEEIKKIQQIEEQNQLLGQYIINMMYQVPKARKLSDARKQVLARSIVRVANDIFDDIEHKKAFVAVIAIESEFQKYAQSPTGPRGLTQVARAAFNEGLAKCGVTNVNDDDVWETEINLYAGACYFKNVLQMHNNDPYIAIVAYNQGPNSADIKKYSQYGMLSTPEALKYVARFTFLKRTTTSDQKPDTPNINELPLPIKGN